LVIRISCFVISNRSVSQSLDRPDGPAFTLWIRGALASAWRGPAIRRGLALAVACAAYSIAAPCRAAQDDHPPSKAVAGLDVAPGLEATLFASEPMMLSPSDIDVDERGRVWVCEVVNYRSRNGTRPEGDRILILEDTDGDGRADKSTVFYQGRDIDSALGICVLGNRAIVSVSPNIFVFTDTDGDGKADKKELLFTKTGIPQHDHSAHAFVFGPDGRLYWNFGNQGSSVHDRDGKPVIDLFGRPVVADGKPYHGGMSFRCDLDGRNFEVLAHNFRNNYELAVDSFGGLWQSDNDDDGNRSVRINFLLEYGNYGFCDEMTGAGWEMPRTNREAEIPARHWHQNDPGVVPNLLITGAGAPTGISVYDGDLLPEMYRGQVIHCDAGPGVVRAYLVSPSGAGYKATMPDVDILKGTRDSWFRPSDVCVAPDGSLFVADWYDPGVGGHRMGDITRGRIFRVAPPKRPYRTPSYDFSSAAGALQALESPNLAARYRAWTTLETRFAEAEPALARLFEHSPNPRLRARALWLLASSPSRGSHYIAAAAVDGDPNLRMTALRAARKARREVRETVERLVRDPSAQVRRECAIALRNVDGPQKARLWAELAVQHDGRDRWYLEALGIGAEGDWDQCLAAWLNNVGPAWNSPAGRDIVWRSRSAKTAELLVEILESPRTPVTALPRYLRAFDFLHGPEKDRALRRLAFAGSRTQPAARETIMAESIRRLDPQAVLGTPAQAAALKKLVDSTRGTPLFVDLIERFDLRGYAAELLAVAQSNPENELGVRALEIVLSQKSEAPVAAALRGSDLKVVDSIVRALGSSEDPRAVGLLWPVVADEKRPIDLRRQAVLAVGRTQAGATRLLASAEAGKLSPPLREAASVVLHGSPSEPIRVRADKLFPLAPAADALPLPPIPHLADRTGDPRNGRIVFATIGTCAKCHVVDGQGKDVGPNLSEIGAKLSRQALYESILFPSAAINHDFAAYTVELQNGNVASGILISRTADAIAIKGIDAITRTHRASDVETIKEQSVSLMPADLQKAMTADDLINVVEYLTTLKPAQGANGYRNKKAGDKKEAARLP
jgi:putative membrane-bound dehydrogenase-like protein